jgi:hypothetical protein
VKIKDIKFYVFSIIIAFFAANLIKCDRENTKNVTVYAKENLITLREQIMLSDLFGITGAINQRTKQYENNFKDNIYKKINNFRKTKPKDMNYVFCNEDEIKDVIKVLKNNTNGNIGLYNIGLNKIKEHRKVCLHK